MLGLAFYAGTANTRQLLADRTNLLLDTLEDRIETFLTPVERRSCASSRRDRPMTTDPTRPARPADPPCTASWRPRRRSLGVLFVTPDLKAYRYLRDRGPQPVEDWSQLRRASARSSAAAQPGGGVVWGPPAWSDELRQTVINAHLPIERDGAL